jgi:1-acyl-sn-glycerol-3-phosphate acyltransferase
MKKIMSYLYFLFCELFFRFYCRLTVYGKENLPSSPFILCSNHNSHMDTPALMLATGLPFNQFGMIAAKDYFFDNVWRKYIANLLMNLIPIDRKISRTTFIENISACKHFIEKQGKYLIIYPEGTRSITGEIQAFKRGPAMIASKLAIPLVPAYITGTYNSLKKGKFLPTPAHIYVKIGKPIATIQDSYKLTKLLEKRIIELKE